MRMAASLFLVSAASVSASAFAPSSHLSRRARRLAVLPPLPPEPAGCEPRETAMFVFGIARGVKQGWLHPDYIYVAWEGLKGMFTKITPEGDVTAICAGTGIMPALSFYYNRPQWKNDPMGEGPVLRALVEMIDAPKYTEIKAEQQYDKIK